MTTVDHDPSGRYAGLIARLDLPAKVRLLTGETAFTLPGRTGSGSCRWPSPTGRPGCGD